MLASILLYGFEVDRLSLVYLVSVLLGRGSKIW
uniref:Uncharacterized protein n=1 Tax=Rhizophora mucronata TaxID=61149 RepID=A0A2P2QDW5_RHIMU